MPPAQPPLDFAQQSVAMLGFSSLLLTAFISNSYGISTEYLISDKQGLGKRFDGIGGLSGGGATSKLLVNYPEPQRSQILDLLFLPNYGASLQILKVEIGGDDQTTDGTESSHMHEEWDENYERGYEWWLIKEAKKRNPSIKLYGLSWSFPGWVGEYTTSPYKNITKLGHYTLKWIQGAKKVHGIDIDYVGIWNEKPSDLDYIILLRKMLDSNGFKNVKIVAPDGWMSAKAYDQWYNNTQLMKSLYAIGLHYPGTTVPKNAIRNDTILWSSEDYSTFNDNVGAGCWARILNQNFARGHMTSTISWNLIASYYSSLPYPGDGLMTANEPWSGHYHIQNPIWISAHTTQFSQKRAPNVKTTYLQFAQIGWRYLLHGQGAGLLKYGGSYVTLTDESKDQITIVIETMSHDHSICIRPALPPYIVKPQKVRFTLDGTFKRVTKLNFWQTQLGYNGKSSSVFVQQRPVQVQNSSFTMELLPDNIYTMTTLKTGQKGNPGSIPVSKPFPRPYKDDFEENTAPSEPYNLAPQRGVWETVSESNNQFIRQVVTHNPVSWCSPESPKGPFACIGNSAWTDQSTSIDIRIPSINGTKGVFLGLRAAPSGGCATKFNGTFFWLYPNSSNWKLTSDLNHKHVIEKGMFVKPFTLNMWHRVGFSISGTKIMAHLEQSTVEFDVAPGTIRKNGIIFIGSLDYGLSDWDNLEIN